MLVVGPVYPQVDFHLRVRKVDLVPLSMKELDTLMKGMDIVQNHIIKLGYLARVQVTLDGVMT